MINVADNFSYLGAKPLDGRIKYDTLAAMKSMADSTLYDGCLAYCVATDKTYQWKSTNTVDPDTGKWREFTSGGGTGGGHTIEDPEGTALTQRDVLQFGGDFDVSDDSTNEKTVVAPHELTAAELAEIVTPLPSVPVNMPILFDETGAEYQVAWYKLANGTKKPVYEKTIDCGALPNNTSKTIPTGIDNIEKVVKVTGYSNNPTGNNSLPLPYFNINNNTVGTAIEMYYSGSNNSIYIRSNANVSTFSNTIVTLLYTKTTDNPT